MVHHFSEGDPGLMGRLASDLESSENLGASKRPPLSKWNSGRDSVVRGVARGSEPKLLRREAPLLGCRIGGSAPPKFEPTAESEASKTAFHGQSQVFLADAADAIDNTHVEDR